MPWYPTSLERVVRRGSEVIREFKNEVLQVVCVFALCVCAHWWGGYCCHPSDSQPLCLAGGSSGHLCKAFFETKTERNCGVLMNRSLNFSKSRHWMVPAGLCPAKPSEVVSVVWDCGQEQSKHISPSPSVCGKFGSSVWKQTHPSALLASLSTNRVEIQGGAALISLI